LKQGPLSPFGTFEVADNRREDLDRRWADSEMLVVVEA
jgi:hypothetical protein